MRKVGEAVLVVGAAVAEAADLWAEMVFGQKNGAGTHGRQSVSALTLLPRLFEPQVVPQLRSSSIA